MTSELESNMADEKNDENSPVKKLRERFFKIKEQSRTRTEKMRETFIKDRPVKDLEDKKKIANTPLPETDL